jgi:hypothetical protein
MARRLYGALLWIENFMEMATTITAEAGMEAPCEVTEQQLREVHIKLRQTKQ